MAVAVAAGELDDPYGLRGKRGSLLGMMTEPGAGAVEAEHAVDPPARVTLLTRAGCHLCDQARAVLARLAAENGFGWDERDVDADPERADAFGDRVPVILVDGREHGYWRIEEARLLQALGTPGRRARRGGVAGGR